MESCKASSIYESHTSSKINKPTSVDSKLLACVASSSGWLHAWQPLIDVNNQLIVETA
jgi:hypothetical protein